MAELRAGRTLSKTAGLCTLYQVAPGDDRLADTCIGMVATPELAAMIVAAVNGELPQVEASVRHWETRLADLQQEMGKRIEAARKVAARAERDRIIALADAVRGYMMNERGTPRPGGATGLPEVLRNLIFEQGKVVIDAAIEQAMAGERAAILDGLRPATVLLRDGDGREISAVPWSVILAALGEGATDD